jgi:hypothetical protein
VARDPGHEQPFLRSTEKCGQLKFKRVLSNHQQVFVRRLRRVDGTRDTVFGIAE